jgi:predicted site-specific integrase-resolvase
VLQNNVRILNMGGIDSMLTTAEVAAILGIQQSTIRRWRDMGLLRSVYISLQDEPMYRYKDIASFLGNKNG